MFNILVIGLDLLSKKIIDFFKNDNKIFGFDFDVDKIQNFYNNNLINNSPSIILNDLLKKTDIVILNIEYSKYKNIFKFIPFIKENCLIINTNIYKKNINDIKNSLQIRKDNFIACNFLFFPNSIILNYDNSTKMNTIHKASTFFHNMKIKTSVLEPEENDKIFCNIYHIPYLLELVLFKETKMHFVINEDKYINYDFFFNDITLNKGELLNNIKSFISNISVIKNDFDISTLTRKYYINCLNNKDTLNQTINDDIFIKILFEKIFIKTFITKDSEYYLDLSYLNFDYIKYDNESIENYYKNNTSNLQPSLVILKEKIISLLSFLQFDNISINKKTIEQFLIN